MFLASLFFANIVPFLFDEWLAFVELVLRIIRSRVITVVNRRGESERARVAKWNGKNENAISALLLKTRNV